MPEERKGARNYKGKESEQSKARRKSKKKSKEPKPWYLGWGLARFAGEAKEKRKKKIQSSEAAQELERQKRAK